MIGTSLLINGSIHESGQNARQHSKREIFGVWQLTYLYQSLMLLLIRVLPFLVWNAAQ
jgi:hypothetical protein